MKRTNIRNLIEVLDGFIEMLQSDNCDGCAYEKLDELASPCSRCARSMVDYYRREIKQDERTST